MQQKALLLIVVFTVVSLFAQTDSSDLIFEDLKVYSYELDFYSDTWESELEANYEAQEYIPAKFTYGDIVLDSVGVRYKGNSSYMMSSNTSKKPYKIKFDKYIDDQTFFGVKKLNFSNCAKDPSFMREAIGYEVARSIDIASRTAFAKIYAEGELIGLYVQVEQVDKPFLEKHFEEKGYNLYKAGDDGASLQYSGTDQSLYYSEYELKTNETLNDWSALVGMIDVVNNSSDPAELDGEMDLDNFMRHFAFCQVFSHFDSYIGSGRNFYLYDDSTSGQFNIIPWDLNEVFGNYANNWDVINADITDASMFSQRPLAQRILENDSLTQIYLGYIKQLIEGPASYDSISARIDELQPFLDSYVQEDPNKLYTYEDFVTNVDTSISSGMGGPGPGPVGPSGSIQGLRSFTESRNSAIQAQLEQYLDPTSLENVTSSGIATAGLQVSMADRSGKINYTVPQNSNNVSIELYTVRGARIASLNEGYKTAGSYSRNFAVNNVASGLYILKISAGTATAVSQCLINK